MTDTPQYTETLPESEPAEGPPQPRPRPALVRTTDGRMIAGVADGLAAAWGWKTWVVRLGFIVATALAGLGLVLYAAGWLLIPEEGRAESVAQRLVNAMNIQRNWVGFGLLVIGGFIVGSVANIDMGVLVAGALLVTGYALYRGEFTIPVAPSSDTGEGESPASIYTRAARTPCRVRPKSYLGRLTVGATLLTLGVMGALDATAVARPTSRHYAAAAVLVIGIGLILGMRFGRSRGLIVLGLLLLPILAVAAIAEYRFGTTWDEVTIRPANLAELQASYQLAAGDLSIDLSAIEFSGETIALDLSTGIGTINVNLPGDVAIEATGNAIVGEVGVEGRRSSGLGAAVAATLDGTAGKVVVDADVRIGSINVYSQRPFDPVSDVGFDPTPTIAGGEYIEVAEGLAVWEPATVTDIAGTYQLFGGRLILDLTSVDETDSIVHIDVAGYGSASILVPGDARVFASSDLPFEMRPNAAPDPTGRYQFEKPGEGITYVIDAAGVTVSIEER